MDESADSGNFNFSQNTDVIIASAKNIENEYRSLSLMKK